jgi:hypothetical protein
VSAPFSPAEITGELTKEISFASLVARTVIRAFLVAGILSPLNQLSPHEPLIQLCKWLVPAWAFRYLVEPITRLLFGALRRIVTRRRR